MKTFSIVLFSLLIVTLAKAQQICSIQWKIEHIDVDTTADRIQLEQYSKGVSKPYHAGEIMNLYDGDELLVDSFLIIFKDKKVTIEKDDFRRFYKNCGPDGIEDVLEIELSLYLVTKFSEGPWKDMSDYFTLGTLGAQVWCGSIGVTNLFGFSYHTKATIP